MEREDATRYADLAEQLATRRTLPETSHEVLEQAHKHLDAEMVCLTWLLRSREWLTLGASNGAVARADTAQRQLDEGPTLEAAREQQLVTSTDLRAEQRWAHWSPQAVDLGLVSVLSVGLHNERGPLGALTVAWSSPRRFADDDVAGAHLFARHSAVALSAARSQETLTAAMEARTLTGQAQGVLMARYGIDAQRAFAVLQRLSQNNNVKLRVVAEDVVRRLSLPDDSVLARP